MRDKLNTLPVAKLRTLAREAGISGVSSLKKSQLVDALCRHAEQTAQTGFVPTETDTAAESDKVQKPQASSETPPPAESFSGGESPAPKTRVPLKNAQKRPQAEPAADTAEPVPDDAPEPRPEASASGVKPISPYNSGEIVGGILEIMADGFGFLRNNNFMPGDHDIYISPQLIRRFNLKTGDHVSGMKRIKLPNERNAAILYITEVNGRHPGEFSRCKSFETMTPVFPDERIHLETADGPLSMRIVDLISPIGKGQRGMIVSPPKAGKTTLLKQTAKSILANHPDMNLIVLLIDERPEEVTDIKESISGEHVEVYYSTFDELPEHHRRVSEMVLTRAKRLVECHQDVTILLDSITRLARAYNQLVSPSGRTLSGGLDPAALYAPKQFFGAARNMREKGSLTILATALVETGSRMDDVVFEEFKGTGNMELVLDRSLSEKRIFPAIDILKSGTRRDDLLLTREEQDVMYLIRRFTGGTRPEDAIERILEMFAHTKNNREFLVMVRKTLASAKYAR